MKQALLIIIAFLVGAVSILLLQTRIDKPQGVMVLTTAQNAMPGMPFSEATRIGNTIYVSGQIGVAPGTSALVQGGVKEETRQVMQNIREILERHGSSMQQVAKCTVFIGDMSQWSLMNEAYTAAFGSHRPARSAVGVSGIGLNGAVEIDCLAYVQ